jgi:hypothetical protein
LTAITIHHHADLVAITKDLVLTGGRFADRA